jgi:hypothetical protein
MESKGTIVFKWERNVLIITFIYKIGILIIGTSTLMGMAPSMRKRVK